MDDQAARTIAELRSEIQRLGAEVDELRAENRQLREQLEQAQRAAARQAAPFRRRERQKVADDARKTPGRKPGHKGHCRPQPPQIDEVHEVALRCCPRCGGPIRAVYPVEQIIEEIPPLRPRVHKLVTYRGRCERCGEVRSRHPLQTSDGQGAAKVQLGPRALALAATLNKVHGLTMRTTCRVLQDMAGLRLTPGGLSQAEDRAARGLQQEYQALVGMIRGSPAVFADETSWWVGGPGWWLWTFTTPEATVYRVDESRGSAVVREVLGDDFAGMLVSDCLASYDPPPYRKHKCIAHHLRAIREAAELPGQHDKSYLREWELLLRSVIVMHGLWREGVIGHEDLVNKRQHLEAWVDQLLMQPPAQGGDARIQNRLRKQRPHLLGCLYEPAAEPTNNRAERSLRPAVIARKVSCGNKTDRGRITWQTLASLGRTCRQSGVNVIDYLATRLSLAPSAG